MKLMQNPGRIAGLWYLLLVLIAPYRLMYIPSTLFVANDAAATARNIASHESMFRMGMVTDVLCGLIVVCLTLAFYRLFKDVNHTAAVMVVVFGGILPAAIDFFNILNDAATLMLVRGPEFLSVFDTAQREAMALLFLRLHHQVVVGAEILWGIWLLPLALLTYKSRFLPRFLGVWLAVNGVGYIVMSLTGFLVPHREEMVSNFAFPALLGEIALMLWLLIKGATPWRAAETPA